ncbi:hypothetical protein SAMN05444370_103313 [Rubrimonas cliftonensis]|uniref:TRAP transporter solute receptor, TAXI family n=2 Tax=Rubrimonas cliftonensis TaxID=89524 RepID=A0A1H3YZ10_9RHOB|nr:hypothetical protein SAMN05444370_103313 [Rubrimonas cliftonensis]
MSRRVKLVAALCCALAGWPAWAQGSMRLFSLGSGELDGGYHDAARALCASVNDRERGRLRCSPETTPGSRYNIDALASGELDMAITQSDLAWKAVEAGVELRVASMLYVETLALLIRPGMRFDGLQDLLGARVDIGPPASGRNATLTALLEALETPAASFAELSRRTGSDAVEALCDGALDAVMLIVGHPSALVAKAIDACGARLTPFAGPRVVAATARAPFFRTERIPAGLYSGVDGPVPTLGVAALLVARADTPTDMVAAVAEALVAPSRNMMLRAPLLAEADPTAVAEGFGPIVAHAGVERAFEAAP